MALPIMLEQGIVQPVRVAAYLEQLPGKRSAPTVKQHLVCIPNSVQLAGNGSGDAIESRALRPGAAPFGDEGPYAGAVLRGSNRAAHRHRCFNRRGSARPGHYRRDDVHLTFARVGAVGALTVEDHFPQKKRWWLRLHEKNGKLNEMPCHHKLEEYLDAYIKAARIAGTGAHCR